jgi:pimeloyl-ACP methyl ester carboxylesterase
MPTVTSRDGTIIAYDEVGTGQPLVLVDPAAGHRGFGPLEGLAPVLGTHFRVIRYDRRGRGESGDRPPYAVEREVEDLEAVIGDIGGWAFVYGFSSGAVLGLLAAGRGVAIPRLAILEPPIDTESPGEGDAAEDPLRAEIADLLAQGRNGDAAEAFHRGIGVPDEYVAAMRHEPWWPALVAVAPTLVYDLAITPSLRPTDLASIRTRTLVLASGASDERLRAWARGVAERLPNGTHRELPGEWHGVDPAALREALVEFFGSS